MTTQERADLIHEWKVESGKKNYDRCKEIDKIIRQNPLADMPPEPPTESSQETPLTTEPNPATI